MDYNFNKFYRNWALAAAIINLIGVFVALFLNTNLPWIIISSIIFLFFIAKIPNYISKLPLGIGYANLISIFRLVIIILSFISYTYFNDIVLFIIFLFVIFLDGVDGYVARKFNHISTVGGKLDMEIDAYLVLVLSWIHIDQKSFELWILIPGGMKYFYEVGFFWLKEKGVKYPPKFIRATIAVLFFLSLLTPFILNKAISELVISISGGLIVISFLISLGYDMSKIYSRRE